MVKRRIAERGLVLVAIDELVSQPPRRPTGEGAGDDALASGRRGQGRAVNSGGTALVGKQQSGAEHDGRGTGAQRGGGILWRGDTAGGKQGLVSR